MTLTDMKIKKLKPGDTPYKVSDGAGLSLIITPQGGKWWRFRYRFDGKEKSLSFGIYPDVPLESAREKRTVARQQVAAGVDPSEHRKQEKAARVNTLERVAREWFLKTRKSWSKNYATDSMRRLEAYVFPLLGKKFVKDITPMEVLDCLRRIEFLGYGVTVRSVKGLMSVIFKYAIASGYCGNNPVANIGPALAPVVRQNLASITEPSEVGGLLRSIDAYTGTIVVKSALQLAPLVFVRPGELRKATWSEINFEAALWEIPGKRMKMRLPHIVPLSRQAIEILKGLYPFTVESGLIFPGLHNKNKQMSNNAVLSALRRMGYEKSEMSGHGFRAMARTILDEVLKFRPDIIEHQLAHTVRDPNGRAYNRTTFLPERIAMMQAWSDYLDKLKAGARVIPFPKTGTDG